MRPASDENFAWMARHLQTCRDKHEKCRHLHSDARSENILPLRLIEVGPVGDDKVLFSSAPFNSSVAFAAASYVWGEGTKEYRTTKSNLRQRCEGGVCVSELPRTIRDLIAVTRRLGLTHLWIDALCIVQDDEAEIKNEIYRMDQFYSHADIVVCAAMAGNSEDGFLPDPRTVERSYGVVYELPYQWRRWGDEEKQVMTMLPETTVWLSEKKLLNETRLDGEKEPIEERMWTVQERVAATRLLYFGSRQVRWKCKQTEHIDGGEFGIIDDRMVQIGSGQPTIFIEFVDAWNSYVSNFSSCSYSDQTTFADRIKALENSVKEQSTLSGWPLDQICCGIWMIEYPWSLLWKKSSPQPIEARRGPSWSWLSLAGQVEYETGIRFSRLCMVKAKVLSFPMDSSGENPLVLSGRAIDFFCHGVKASTLDSDVFAGLRMYWDVYLEPQQIWLLEVICPLEALTFGIILSKGQRGSFRRCGYFNLRIGQSDGSDMVTERWSEEQNFSIF